MVLPKRNNGQSDESVSPEKVYRGYRLIRSVEQSSTDINSSSDSDSDEFGVAEKTYSAYQASRLSSEQSDNAVDDIMLVLKEHSTAQLTEQPAAQADAPKIESVGGKLARIKPLLMPAVAAAVVVFGILPLLLNTTPVSSPTGTTVPHTLANNAAAVTPYIDDVYISDFGFSSGSESENDAFQAGVLSTDLLLATDAKDSDLISSLINKPVANYKSAYPDLAGALTELKSVSESNANTDQYLAAFESTYVALEAMAIDKDQSDWFAMGQSIESIALAAEYGLSTSNSQPMIDAIELAGALAMPSSKTLASGLIERLLNSEIENPATTRQMREIMTSVNNIKVLMR